MTAWALDRVSKGFGPFEAVRSVSLQVEEGERVGVIGESGSGKTTLVRVGLGLIPRDSGTITLFGEDTSGWSRRRWRRARRGAQLLFQDPRAMLNPALPLELSLAESAALHRPDRDPVEAAREILQDVGLPSRSWSRPGELSGGELRRAGLARVLLARPRLLVADEPTAGLDASLKAGLLELTLARIGSDCAFVLISHDLPMVAWATERIVVMKAGQIVDHFDSSALERDPFAGRHPHTIGLLTAAGYR